MNLQHTMLLSPTPSAHPATLDALDDAELDELGYGVIGIDATGTILRYNLAEAQFARLDRTTVIGKLFFSQVAPCTATPEFQGRFEAYHRDEQRPSSLRFDYLFDFKFGAQEVEVEIVPARGANRYYILVNRLKSLDPREDLPEGFAAPRQRELVDPVQELGISRGRREQRDLKLPIAWLGALLRTCDQIAPETWSMFSREWGQMLGRRASIDLEVDCLDHHGHSLKECTMEEAADQVTSLLGDQGWGRLQIDLSLASRGAIAVTLRNSALAAANRKEGVKRCHLLSGVLGALFTHLAGRRLFVLETRCACQGYPSCEFVVVGETLHERMEALVDHGVYSVTEALENLERQDEQL